MGIRHFFLSIFLLCLSPNNLWPRSITVNILPALLSLMDEVMECLSELDTTKACGPDKIPARLVKECSKQIAPSLCSLFNHSLSIGSNSS